MICFFCSAQLLYAEDVKLLEKSQTKALCDNFMDQLVAGRFKAAFDTIKPHFPVEEAKFEAGRDVSINGLVSTMTAHGGLIGYTFYKEEDLQDTVVRYVYTIQLRQHLLRWVFVFYKPKDGWMLNGYFWDDNLDWFFASA